MTQFAIFIKTSRDIALTNSETYLENLLFAINSVRENSLSRISLTKFSSQARRRITDCVSKTKSLTFHISQVDLEGRYHKLNSSKSNRAREKLATEPEHATKTYALE